MITIGTGNDAGSDGLGRARDAGGKKLWTQDASAQPFGVIRHGGGLTISAGIPKLGGGWAVYTFTDDYPFTIYVGAVITADVLLVGGGGSGGGGTYGGGGGGGGFVDKHGVIIYSASHTPPHDTAVPDGPIVVGKGGAEVPWTASLGNQGGDSKLGAGLIAYGGGYGGRNGGANNYAATGGGSGGGSGGHEVKDEEPFNGVDQWHGIPGAGLCRMTIPTGANAKDYEQGHDGGVGHDTGAWYDHSAGGGGGANWPANGYGYGAHGGMGRPCDISGWYQTGGIYGEAGFRIIPWFSGGGAGKQRENSWGYPEGQTGFGNAAGHGGDGNGYFGVSYGTDGGKAPGFAGQDGLVVVRIPLVYKPWITSPLQLTDEEGKPLFNQVWDAWKEEYVPVAAMPAGVSYHELPPEQIHTDEMGDEVVTYWAWPPDHLHHWGWENI